MKLNNPVTITRVDNNEVIIKDLYLMIVDNCSQKTVMVVLLPINKSITLWKDEEYDNIGDYTQAQVEDKVLIMMGDDQAKFLQSL